MRNPFQQYPIGPQFVFPANQFFHTNSWKGGLNVSDAPEDSVPGQSFEMIDMEVTDDDSLVRAPGVTLTDSLLHSPAQVFLHAGFQYASAMIFIAPPFVGVKEGGAIQWFDASLQGATTYGHTNFAGVLLLTNGSRGIYARQPGKLALELIPKSVAGFSLAVFAGRVVVGGAQIDGKLDFMGVSWSDSTSDYKGWDIALGAAGQSLIGTQAVADRIQGLEALGFETLAVINRRSIWVGVPTGDVFQPIRFSERLKGVGCVKAQTIQTTEFGVIFLADDGVRMFTGNDAPVISLGINRLLGPIRESDTWNSSFDPFRKRYYLHGPTGTWVFDLKFNRWFHWRAVLDGSVFFPAQGTRLRWSDAVGTWGSQTLAWWQLLPQESGGQMYFTKSGALGVESQDSFTVFGTPLDPLWFDRIQVGENQDQLMTGLGARFTYEASAASQVELWLPDKPDGNYEPVTTATLPIPTAFTKRAWAPFIHTGRGIGLGLRILAGSPKIRRASVEYQLTGMLFEATSSVVTPPPPPVESSSDAVLKLRIIWTDGQGMGEIDALGKVDLPASISIGRYLQTSGVATNYPADPPNFVLGTAHIDARRAWTYVPTGGPGGAGYLTSKVSDAGSNGHWNFVGMRTDSPPSGGAAELWLNLFNKTLPADGLTFAGLASNVVTGTSVPSALVFTILSNYKLCVRKVVGTDPSLWPVLGTSTFEVPATGWFAVELGGFFSSTPTAPNGLVYLRYHTEADVLGVEAVRVLNILTGGSRVYGLVWGADARSLAGISNAVEGIGFAGPVVCDIGGTTRRYLHQVRVGTSLVIGNGPTIQSTVFHGSSERWQNVAVPPLSQAGCYIFPVGRVITLFADPDNAGLLAFFSTTYTETENYNTFLDSARDTYAVAAALAIAKEILALVPQVRACGYKVTGLGPLDGGFHTRLVLNDSNGLTPGSGNVVLVSGAAEVAAPDAIVSAPDWTPLLVPDKLLVAEVDPETSVKFLPSKIASVLIAWQNNLRQVMINHMALEYVFRTQEIIETEPAAHAPIAVLDVEQQTINIFQFKDSSVDWDGTVVSRVLDFGDGSPTLSMTEFVVYSHTYLTNGTFQAVLTVTDNDGLTTIKTVPIVVANQLPLAAFNVAANPDDPSGLTVDFTDLSGDPDGTVVAWDWDFGDGSPHSHDQNPTHTYAGAGTPLVTLKVTDNNGALSAPFTAEVDVPIVAGGGGDCELSADALANVSYVMGDDFNGGNSPLPAYINTAAFDIYYTGATFREAYDGSYDTIHDGVSHFLDSSKLFAGHKTLAMTFGNNPAPSGHPYYFGAGWDTVPTDDGEPEVYYPSAPFGPGVFWLRRVFNADADIIPPGSLLGTQTFRGLMIFDASGANVEAALFIRNGRVYLDYSTRPSGVGGIIVTGSINVCAETLFVGRGDALFGEIIVRLAIDDTAHTMDIRVWAGDACTLGGVSPIVNQVVSAYPLSGVTPLGFNFIENWVHDFVQQAMTNKQLNVALWEQQDEALTSDVNPYGVALT